MLSTFITPGLCILGISYIVIYNFSTLHQITDTYIIRNASNTNNSELKIVAEELFDKASNELYNYVSIQYQGQLTFKNITDNASERLLNVSSEVFSTTTTKSLIKLFNNYELNTYKEETLTEEEDIEENEFIDDIMSSNVMLHTMNFLSTKGFFMNNIQVYKTVLKKIWFHPYSRSKGVNGSSGFEHVFLVEKKPRKGIIGLHNWIFFSIQELSNNINYYGYLQHKNFGDRAVIAKVHFTYDGKHKMSSMFIGTIPELEIALYTLCFFTRPNKKCTVSFAGIKFGIQTFVHRNGDEEYIAAAYPLI